MGGLPYFCVLSSGVRGQRCWNYPPLLATLLLFLILTLGFLAGQEWWWHLQEEFVSFRDVGPKRLSQAPGSGPTCHTQAALSGLNVNLNNLKRRCKNLVGKLVVEGKHWEENGGGLDPNILYMHVCILNKTFCEGVFYIWSNVFETPRQTRWSSQ